MNTTPITITKPFWAIVRCRDFGYHTGKPFDYVTLIECDSAMELEVLISSGCVEAGESMGTYVYDVLALYQSWEVHTQNVMYEEQAKIDEVYKNE